MKYYRSKVDIKNLAEEFKAKFTHRSQILQYIQKKHNLVTLGVFTSVLSDSIWVGDGDRGQKSHKFKVSGEVLDFLVNKGAFMDGVKGHNLVDLFGRVSKGKVVDVVALNMSNLVDPSDL